MNSFRFGLQHSSCGPGSLSNVASLIPAKEHFVSTRVKGRSIAIRFASKKKSDAKRGRKRPCNDEMPIAEKNGQAEINHDDRAPATGATVEWDPHNGSGWEKAP